MADEYTPRQPKPATNVGADNPPVGPPTPTPDQPYGAGKPVSAGASQKQAELHGLTDAQGNIKLDTPIDTVKGLSPELIENYNRQVEKYNREQNIKRAQQMSYELRNPAAIKEQKETTAQQQKTLAELEKTRAQKLQELEGIPTSNFSKSKYELQIKPQRQKLLSEIATLDSAIASMGSIYQGTQARYQQDKIQAVGKTRQETALEAHKRLGSQVETRNVGGATVLSSMASPETKSPSRSPSVLTSLTDVKAAESLGWGSLGVKSQQQETESGTISSKFKSVDMVTPVTLQEQQQKDIPTQLYEGLRYSEKVERGEVKPEGIEWLLYGGSQFDRGFFRRRIKTGSGM